MRVRLSAVVGLACACASVLASNAFAQTPAEPTPASPEPASECFPTCRDGYLCHEGQCISACNPPCQEGYACQAGGSCEALPAPAAAPAPSTSAAIADYEAEPERATAYRHDGFYLRLGFTIGYAIDRAERGDGLETESSGPGGFIDYAIGGSPTEGLVIAFAQHTLGVFSPDTKVGGNTLEADHSALYQVLGLMVDIYPDPTRGLHGAVTLGFGAADILRSEYNDSLGFGLGLTAGYDFWFAEQWSFGLAGQLFYINGSEDEFGSHEAIVPMIALSALLH